MTLVLSSSLFRGPKPVLLITSNMLYKLRYGAFEGLTEHIENKHVNAVYSSRLDAAQSSSVNATSVIFLSNFNKLGYSRDVVFLHHFFEFEANHIKYLPLTACTYICTFILIYVHKFISF